MSLTGPWQFVRDRPASISCIGCSKCHRRLGVGPALVLSDLDRVGDLQVTRGRLDRDDLVRLVLGLANQHGELIEWDDTHRRLRTGRQPCEMLELRMYHIWATDPGIQRGLGNASDGAPPAAPVDVWSLGGAPHNGGYFGTLSEVTQSVGYEPYVKAATYEGLGSQVAGPGPRPRQSTNAVIPR